jgi:hypothetical protein
MSTRRSVNTCCDDGAVITALLADSFMMCVRGVEGDLPPSHLRGSSAQEALKFLHEQLVAGINPLGGWERKIIEQEWNLLFRFFG